MEDYGALALAVALWLPAVLGQPAWTTRLAGPLAVWIGPIWAGAVVAAAIAAAGVLAAGAAFLIYQAVRSPEGVPDRSTTAHDLMILPLTREGNVLPATLALLAPLFLAARLLLLPEPSPVVGELIVLATTLCLAGLQSLRATDYRRELLPAILSFGRAFGQLTRRDRLKGEPPGDPSITTRGRLA